MAIAEKAWSPAAQPAAIGAPAPKPAVSSGPSTPRLPDSLLADLHGLVEDARTRAHVTEAQPVDPSKAHLDQADIDRLFGLD